MVGGRAGLGGRAVDGIDRGRRSIVRLVGLGMARHGADVDRSGEWEDLRTRYLASPDHRAPSSARGLHHRAVQSHDRSSGPSASSRGGLDFTVTELFENRDHRGSTHCFFDIGHGHLVAFFDFPGLELGAVRRGARGHAPHRHLGDARDWDHLRSKLEAAGVATTAMSGSSLYFNGPDGERLELIKDPLREMYGLTVARESAPRPGSITRPQEPLLGVPSTQRLHLVPGRARVLRHRRVDVELPPAERPHLLDAVVERVRALGHGGQHEAVAPALEGPEIGHQGTDPHTR